MTRKEILEKELSQETAEKAIRNISRGFLKMGAVWLNSEAGPVESVTDVLRCGFTWGFSPEGYGHWNDIVKLKLMGAQAN